MCGDSDNNSSDSGGGNNGGGSSGLNYSPTFRSQSGAPRPQPKPTYEAYTWEEVLDPSTGYSPGYNVAHDPIPMTQIYEGGGRGDQVVPNLYDRDPRNQQSLNYGPNGETNRTGKTNTTPPSKDDGDNKNKKPPGKVTADENARRRAISARNAAINTKQAAINKAFTDKYTTDYYSGLRTAYNDEYLDDLQSAYDASMRGIWEGIRNTGVYDQAGFDASKGKLDTAKTAEIADLDKLAKAYRDSQIKAVGDVRSGILSDLSGLYSGNDVSASQAAAEQAAVEGYSYLADMETLRETPSMLDAEGNTPTFFSGFNQAAARQAARTPTVRSGRSPQQEQQAGGLARTMVRSPVGGGSSTVIRG